MKSIGKTKLSEIFYNAQEVDAGGASKNSIYDVLNPVKVNTEWLMGKLTGASLSNVGSNIVDSDILVLFKGEPMKISYSDLLTQIQTDLGL